MCCALDLRPRVWTADEMRAVDHAAEACTALFVQQLARQEVERQRRFLDAILASLRVGVAACDETGRVTLTNAAMRELVGDPLPAGEVPLLRALRGEQVRDAEALVVGPDGRRRLLQMDGQPITDPGAGAVVTVQDVTARRRAERFRAGELAVTTALAEAATVPEAGRRILPAVAGTLGWPHAELWLVDTGPDTPSGKFGVIASVSHAFCSTCDRTRLTADGQIRSCLFSAEETDLRGLLRGGAPEA